MPVHQEEFRQTLHIVLQNENRTKNIWDAPWIYVWHGRNQWSNQSYKPYHLTRNGVQDAFHGESSQQHAHLRHDDAKHCKATLLPQTKQ